MRQKRRLYKCVIDFTLSLCLSVCLPWQSTNTLDGSSLAGRHLPLLSLHLARRSGRIRGFGSCDQQSGEIARVHGRLPFLVNNTDEACSTCAANIKGTVVSVLTNGFLHLLVLGTAVEFENSICVMTLIGSESDIKCFVWSSCNSNCQKFSIRTLLYVLYVRPKLISSCLDVLSF